MQLIFNHFYMQQNLTIEIINNKAINLLYGLERLNLIRVQKNSSFKQSDLLKYKGAMTKQTVEEIDTQLNELRNAWE